LIQDLFYKGKEEEKEEERSVSQVQDDTVVMISSLQPLLCLNLTPYGRQAKPEI
jgi:hypothetical protein